jgi:amino acid transporter
VPVIIIGPTVNIAYNALPIPTNQYHLNSGLITHLKVFMVLNMVGIKKLLKLSVENVQFVVEIIQVVPTVKGFV